MHEVRVYSDYPEQGGRLKKVVPPAECRKAFWKNVQKFAAPGKFTELVCDRCKALFVTTSTAPTRYCGDCRVTLDEEKRQEREATREARKPKKERPAREPLPPCAICEGEIPKHKPKNTRTCSGPCYTQHKINKERQRRAEILLEKKRKFRAENNIVCKQCGGQIPDDRNIAARFCTVQHMKKWHDAQSRAK